MHLQQRNSYRCFGGNQLQFSHNSTTLNCTMQFSIFLPPQADTSPVPVLYWLSGLTCTDQNFVQKAGAQRYASEHGIAIVCPDTSPRGADVPGDPDGSWDFGHGAGFYVNATQAPWDQHYRMYDYVSRELPALINEHFPVLAGRQSISGHSMGGHGALTIALNNQSQYRSVSAFAPIVAPTHCPWGQKALGRYLGPEPSAWCAHDTCELIRSAPVTLPIRIDQGDSDSFLFDQLKPDLLLQTAARAGVEIDYHLHAGYDHSYFFIATFIGAHIAFHSRYLLEN
jgi:S-formylglutathione hydrolase